MEEGTKDKMSKEMEKLGERLDRLENRLLFVQRLTILSLAVQLALNPSMLSVFSEKKTMNLLTKQIHKLFEV